MKKCGMERWKTALVLIAVFLFFLLFFFKLHPIMIFDTDDWLYAYAQRTALLQWKGWNPAKILPETLQPLVTLVGAFGFDLFLKDHFLSISFSYALVVSLAVTSMAGMLYIQLRKGSGRVMLLAYFLLCHFWIYRTQAAGNLHMLYSPNATCFFNYVIPNLLNCTLVLWLMKMSSETPKEPAAGYSPLQDAFLQLLAWQKGLFILLVYFAVFSNLWASIILAVYVGAVSLFDGVRMIRDRRFSLMAYLKGHLLPAGILLLWAVQQVYELNGVRAETVGGGPFWPGVLDSLRACVALALSCTRRFLLCSALILLAGLALAVFYKEKETLYRLGLLATSFCVSGLYLVLSCARTGSGYLSRPDVHYVCFFFGMLMLLACLDVILRKLPPVKTLMPLFLVIVLCHCNTSARTYQDSIMGNYSPAACMRFCRDVEQQFLDAQERGEERIVLVVPEFGDEDNWPIARNAGPRFSAYFYKMGITEKEIEVIELDPQPEKNLELRL